MSEELKPCPFCGGEAHLKSFAGFYGHTYSVGCPDSGCMGFEILAVYKTKEDAAAAWNRRVEPADGFDLDKLRRVCFECMGCCDEPELTLYTAIYDAIARYRRGESGPTCDIDALLALADGLQSMGERSDAKGRYDLGTTFREIAGRIREALGVGTEKDTEATR